MIDDDRLCLDGILHVESGLLDQGEESDVGILDAENMEGVDHVAHDLFALLDGGMDQKGDIR